VVPGADVGDAFAACADPCPKIAPIIFPKTLMFFLPSVCNGTVTRAVELSKYRHARGGRTCHSKVETGYGT
jgi:hypothetical protein